MDKKTEGSWLIHHTQKLTRVNNISGYDNLYTAGKAGLLLSAISASKQQVLEASRLDSLARGSNITNLELKALLDLLEEKFLIQRSKTSNDIEVLGLTTHAALEHTADIFESSNANETEKASLITAETTSSSPQKQKQLIEKIGDELKISNQSCTEYLNDYSKIGFIDREEVSNTDILYFNGNLFRRGETAKINRVLESLKSEEELKLIELNSELHRTTCIPLDEAKRRLGDLLFNKVTSVGIYDINIVSNNTESCGFITLPSAFSKFSDSMVDDAFDLAKAFVSSITYGMTRSSYERGNIRMVDALLSALVRGEPIGPVAAISQDYKVLELKGVVKVFQGQKGGRKGPMLKLLKREVGELALAAIRQGDISEHSVPDLPGAAVYKYTGPEENRERARKSERSEGTKVSSDILMALRTGS